MPCPPSSDRVLSYGSDVMPRPTLFDRACRPRAVMSCHARRRSTMCAFQRQDGMPRPTSFDRLCSPKVMMACHARRLSTVCAVQRRRCHATLDIFRPCVLPKGDDGMPRPMSFDCLCCPKVMMACHARCCQTVSASLKAMMACHARRRSTVCAFQRTDGMPRSTSFDRLCCPKVVMACHARRRSTVCAVQRK